MDNVASTPHMAIDEQDPKIVMLRQASALEVRSSASRQDAANLWDAIRAFRKQAEARREEVGRPLKVAWESAKQPYDAFIKECTSAEALLQNQMGWYDRQQARLLAEQQAKLAAKVEKQNAKRIERAESTGIDPVLQPVPVLPSLAKSYETQAGTTQTRTTVKKWRIGALTPEQADALPASDPRLAMLPREVLRIHAATITALVRAGMPPAGVEVYEEYSYRQRS